MLYTLNTKTQSDTLGNTITNDVTRKKILLDFKQLD